MANTINLSGVDLPINLMWTDRHSAPRVRQQVKQTIGGSIVVYSIPIVIGLPITLVADKDTGWMTGQQVQSLENLAFQAGATFVLTLTMDPVGTFGQSGYIAGYTTTQNVMFRHNDAPALDIAPIVPRLNEEVGDYYTGTIKLITV